MPDFEVLMVSIEWEHRDKIKTIVPSKKVLKPSNVNGREYEYDIVIYTKNEDDKYLQFAIKTEKIPYLKGTGIKLYNISDDLWIIKDEWRIGQRGIGYHYCPSINTIGKIEICISEDETVENTQDFITIDINSNIEDFDFNQLKEDFDGELWNLITSKRTNVNTDRVELRYCDKIFCYPENKTIIDFLTSFDNIAKNPKRELSQTTEIRKTEKVIPIVETYRKISTTGMTKYLPSKGIKENYDIFENRIVCSMLYNINQIVEKNIKYSNLQVDRLKKEINSIEKKINDLNEPDPKVDPEEIDKEISYQEQIVERLKQPWESISMSLSPSQSCKYNEFNIKIKGISNNNVFCQINSEYCLIEFNNIIQHLQEDKEYCVIANRTFGDYSDIFDCRIYTIDIKKIFSVELQSAWEILKKQKENKTILQQNKWSQRSILNKDEQQKFDNERNKQIPTLDKKIQKIKSQIENIGNFIKEQENLLPFIKQRMKTDFYSKNQIKNIQAFKPSMTFIQNIHYRNVRKYYIEVLKSEGIEIKVFDLYENIVSYTIREIPQVYELWCLITQIKILEDCFHFKHNPKDLAKLLKMINPNKEQISENIEINFENNLAGRTIKLHYQKKLSDDKRPDFILEINNNSGNTINLVLDSKFKNYNYKKSIIYETIEMKEKYSKEHNYVFILHPCKDGIFENRNIRYTNYGGERIFYGEKDNQSSLFPFHKYGYIELKPNFTDNLQKLIAMAFEYLLEPSNNAKQNGQIDPKPTNELFCINCGGANITRNKNNRNRNNSRRGNKYYYICNCNEQDCNHEIRIDYCWNCQTKLFKHGSYWDYHVESIWNNYDIRCPQCGKTIQDMPTR